MQFLLIRSGGTLYILVLFNYLALYGTTYQNQITRCVGVPKITQNNNVILKLQVYFKKAVDNYR